jgi:ABC-type oligopeptide transport system ATPase subunit
VTAPAPAGAAGVPAGPDLLSVADLAVTYRARKGPRDRRLARAVDGVSFSVGAGEIFALVGESGCG